MKNISTIKTNSIKKKITNEIKLMMNMNRKDGGIKKVHNTGSIENNKQNILYI